MLDEYIRHFPDSKVPYDIYMLPYAEIYYKAGAPEKANQLIERVAAICNQNLDYYYSYTPGHTQYFEQDIQTTLGMMRRMSMVASQYQQPKLAAKLDTLFNMRMKTLQ